VKIGPGRGATSKGHRFVFFAEGERAMREGRRPTGSKGRVQNSMEITRNWRKGWSCSAGGNVKRGREEEIRVFKGK